MSSGHFILFAENDWTVDMELHVTRVKPDALTNACGSFLEHRTRKVRSTASVFVCTRPNKLVHASASNSKYTRTEIRPEHRLTHTFRGFPQSLQTNRSRSSLTPLPFTVSSLSAAVKVRQYNPLTHFDGCDSFWWLWIFTKITHILDSRCVTCTQKLCGRYE
jgi:hypothetical protein